jgi:hypothetical protein
MEKEYFALGAVENNKLVKIIQIIFGIVCFGVAVFWLIYNIKSLRASSTLWISVIFLTGFGFYEIWAGLGRATRFIEINSDRIILKKNVILPPSLILSNDIQKIEIYPFNLIFFLKSNKKVYLRFGASYQETNEKVTDSIVAFADSNNITIEIKKEEL